MTENTEDVQTAVGDAGDLPVDPAQDDPDATLGEQTKPD